MSVEIPAELLPSYPSLAITAVTVTPAVIGLALTATAATAACPRCRTPARRVHSRYRRRLADRHRLLGFTLGGEPGARVAEALAVPTSPDTLLRRVTATPDGGEPVFRFVGIDDFALRKGQVYGTILIDLEQGRVIDLLGGRDGAAVEAWLKAHPGVQVITRDRWAAYAAAATAGAPQAMQVADRFHLVNNLREVVERIFEAHAAAVNAALTPPTAEPRPLEPTSAIVPPELPPPSPRRQRRVDRFEHVRRLRAEGASIRGIARAMRMSVKTVCKYLRQNRCPDWHPRSPRPTGVDRFTATVDAYIHAGGRQASEVFRTVRTQGCRVGYNGVRRFFNRRLAAAGVTRTRVNAAQPPPPARPSLRQLSFEYVRRAEKRSDEATTRMAAVGGVAAMTDELRLVDEFLGMVRKTVATPLSEWLVRAEQSNSAAVRSFAASLRADEAAVAAGLTTLWSNGPVEGQVNRLKLVKRAMYGRAGFRLLRARVRHQL
jgi:transposase